MTATFEEFRDHNPQLKTVSVDMNAAFPGMVRDYFPASVKLAYDLFPVVEHFHRDVLVEARKTARLRINNEYKDVPRKERTDELKQQRDERRALLVKAEWLVLTAPDLLSGSNRDRLLRLREDNQLFADLYPLADMLRAIWKL